MRTSNLRTNISMEVTWMSRTYEEIKNDFKKKLLEMEQELISNSTHVDDQQVVNKIVKNYEEISKEIDEVTGQ